MMERDLILGITGASGSVYALNFIGHAARLNITLRVAASTMGESVFRHETGLTVSAALKEAAKTSSGWNRYKLYDNSNMFADIASGSCRTDGMVILPCSMKTLSSVAKGYSATLLDRAADVMLKERRPLVLAVRETPFSLIHLKNMVAAAEAGAIILPAAPGFYHSPESIEELADFVSAKIFEQFRIEHGLKTVWHGKHPQE
jgi:flavin prenyltransferase